MPTPLDLFDFPLPQGLIAQHPVSPRDAARLLTVPRAGEMADRAVSDLPDQLRPGDVMVFNDTRVLPVRLKGERPGGRCEVTLIEPVAGLRWRALARPARRLKAGERIRFADGFSAMVTAKGEAGEAILDLEIEGGAPVEDALERFGAMPLPPYIRRPVWEDRDRSDYQTVYARHAGAGAVAAPTAGLHFTPELLVALEARGIGRAMVTLHVGLGTFQPVRAAHLEDHRMHAEWGELTAEAAARIEAARAAGGRVVAVGTTALRLLESAAAGDGRVKPFRGATDLFIMPGYGFRAVDLLMTNFHLPRSTLFVLVCAFAGRARMRAAYAHAVARGYRFYSYGDASLLERAAP